MRLNSRKTILPPFPSPALQWAFPYLPTESAVTAGPAPTRFPQSHVTLSVCSVFVVLMSLGFFALLGICFNCSESTIYCCISPRKGQNWHTGAAVTFSNCTSYSISALKKKMKKALNKVLWIARCLIKERSKLRNIWIYFVDHEASELYLIPERINRVSKVAT